MGYHRLRLVKLGKDFCSFDVFAWCGKPPKPADFLLLSVFFPIWQILHFLLLFPPHSGAEMNAAGFLFDNSRFNLHNSCFLCQDTLVDAGA